MKRYGLALAALAVAVIVRALLSPLLAERAPLLLLTLAVVVSALYLGFGPSLLVTGLGALIGGYLFVAGPGFEHWAFYDQVNVALFVAIGLAISFISRQLQRSRSRAARMTEELAAANRRKDEFLAMLAHELRNPLSAISTAAALLDRTEPGSAPARGASAIIGRQMQHMSRLIDELLDVSRVTRGLASVAREPVDLVNVVHAAIEQLSPLIRAQRHDVTFSPPDGPVIVSGDAVRLTQVVANLLGNAVRYTPPGGRISITLEGDGDSVALAVTDNGCGIGPELMPHIFELFVQGERGLDRAQGGLGIGLALARSLIELHDGSLSAYSEGPGTGSTFTIRLPRLHCAPPAPAAPAPRVVQAPSPRPLRILVTDDNPDAANTLSLFAETLGYSVTTEYHARGALNRAQDQSFDACLLDIGLPEIDGYALCRVLRRMPNTADALIIAITGYGGEHNRERALEAGFDHHLTKPVDLVALSSLLETRAIGETA